MAAQKVLIMGESGTGKSTSMRNCDPATVAVVNPVGKPLPFKNHFDNLSNETDARKITRYMKDQAAAGKKLIVVDDFQYILAVPYMNRIKETGWDKYNDFGANYFEIIEVCKDLPDDVVVAYMTHLETLDNGLTTVKLIGKLLREKITIEGLFTVVLRTGVTEGKYYFFTQNSGKDTVKSPLGMFPTYAIDNDLAYVADKIRNYYEIGEYKTDAEMGQADAAVAADVEKPDTNGRRSRSRKTPSTEQIDTPPTTPPTEKRKTRSEVQQENQDKVNEYLQKRDAAVMQAAGDREEVPFDEACDAADTVPEPDLQKPPRRTRRERTAEQAADPTVCGEDTYFYLPDADNYVMKHKGDAIPAGAKVITKEEFNEGCKRIAQGKAENPVDGEMNSPETPVRGQRRRRTR